MRRADASVGAGILASRVAGLLRAILFAKYLGQRTDPADAFTAAFRIPNLLQNLFGEGALSGSFIPVHAALRARGEQEAASQMARTFFAVLTLLISALVLLGVLAAPWITPALAPGFTGAKRELTIRLVRILFPGAGLLVASAWCLGVLNSHGKFFLSYTAPVAWNAAMIGTLLLFGARHDIDLETLVIYLAWGSVLGSILQFAVQAPIAWRLSRHTHRFAFTAPVREAIRNFGTVLLSRGAVQITAYIDAWIATLLPTGAVTALTNAQSLYTLPVSLFGVSVSATELPAMSGEAARDRDLPDRYAALRTRMNDGLRRLAFFSVPSAVAFVALGDVIAATLLQRGRFKPEDSLYLWGILAGSSVGLLATTMARLYSVAHYALGDARRPVRFAIVRLATASVLGYGSAMFLPRLLGLDQAWGAAGLTASAGFAGWIEFALLRASLNRRIGPTGLAASYVARLWTAGAVGAALAWGVRLALPPLGPLARGAAVLPVFGAGFLGAAMLLRVQVPGLRRRP
jgi:putative peptidoglycan lipid II flippase